MGRKMEGKKLGEKNRKLIKTLKMLKAYFEISLEAKNRIWEKIKAEIEKVSSQKGTKF